MLHVVLSMHHTTVKCATCSFINAPYYREMHNCVQNQCSGMRHILALSEGDAHFLDGAFQGIQDFIWVLFRCPEHVVQSLQNKAASSLLDSVLF